MNQPENTSINMPDSNPTPPSPEPGPDAMADFLAFRRFATPVLIQIAFWIGTLIFVVWGGSIIAAATSRWNTNEAMVWAGIAVIILGPTLLRIAGELVLVIFRIHDRLAEPEKISD